MIKKYSYQYEEIQDDVVVEYPDGDVFLREHNYVKIYTAHETNCTLISVTIAGKEIRFNYDLLKPITFDVSPYYAKGATSISVTIVDRSPETFTIPLKVNTINGYSPFLEFVPERCEDAPYARIVPPNRMLWDGKKSITSMLSAMRDGDYFSGYEYEMEGVPYETYRPSNAWLTTTQKNEHLGETYRNTLPATGNLAELDSNGLPLWIEQGNVLATSDNIGKTFEQLRVPETAIVRTKTIFENYNGLTISAPPAGLYMFICLYDKNKKLASTIGRTQQSVTLNNADTYKYFSINYSKENYQPITPPELVGITSSALTNPNAGKSWRWYNIRGTFKWQEITQEQLVNNKFYWGVNNKSYSNDVINKGFTFGSKFSAKLIRTKNIFSPTSWTPLSTIYSIGRSVELIDSAMNYIYARWLTPWGISVEHLFYLDTYATDKDDAQEVESEYLYEERSKHIIKGSFYLDNIRNPYDLWYYQTLANSELVELYLPIFSVRKEIYMPNASDYVAVKIKGSNIKDAVVDGVTQSTITFNFEMR